MKVGDEVCKDVDEFRLVGQVLAVFQRKDEQRLYVAETSSGSLFIGLVGSESELREARTLCSHDRGFRFYASRDCSFIGYLCNKDCGFSLNFNPDTYPEGVCFI